MKDVELSSPLDFNRYSNVEQRSTKPPIAINEYIESFKHDKKSDPSQNKDKSHDIELSESEIDAFKAITDSIKSDKEVKLEKARIANRKSYQRKKSKMPVKSQNKSKKETPVEKNIAKMPAYITEGMPAVRLIMKQHLNNRYKDGCDVAPVQVMGNNAYNKECKKNAFERLMIEQEKFNEWGIIPEWFIIQRDDVTICDPHLVSKLLELQEYTHAVGAMGVSAIRRSGKFFRPDSVNDVKGALIQAELDSSNWKFMKAPDYDSRSGFQVAAITSGLLAVRGRTFMDIDFRYMAENSVTGFEHFIADICMEVNKRNCIVGVIKTLIRQEDTIANHTESDEFRRDHNIFVRKWQQYLPIRF